MTEPCALGPARCSTTSGVKIPSINVTVKGMSGGQRQCLAIARAILWGRRIVILDEPTAALGVRESQQVLDLILRLKSHNVSVIVVSHNMAQLAEVADKVTVMRLGRTIATRTIADTSVQEIVGLITGAVPADAVATAPEATSDPNSTRPPARPHRCTARRQHRDSEPARHRTAATSPARRKSENAMTYLSRPPAAPSPADRMAAVAAASALLLSACSSSRPSLTSAAASRGTRPPPPQARGQQVQGLHGHRRAGTRLAEGPGRCRPRPGQAAGLGLRRAEQQRRRADREQERRRVHPGQVQRRDRVQRPAFGQRRNRGQAQGGQDPGHHLRHRPEGLVLRRHRQPQGRRRGR